MVKGATYYRKFEPNPIITLSGYTGTYKVLKSNNQEVTQGDMVTNDNNFEMSVSTENLVLGKYRFQAFVQFPDGFIQNIHDETVDII